MEKRMRGHQSQDAATLRGFPGLYNGMLPPVAAPLQARESSSLALERIFDQINSSSSDIRSVMDLLDSVRSKNNSMAVQKKGQVVRRGGTHRGPGGKDQETSLAEAPAHELRDSDMLARHQSGRNDHSSLSQKNTDFLSIRNLAQTTPPWRSSRDGCSVPIGDVRSSPQSSGDIDAAKPATLSVCKESPIDNTELQLPAGCVSGQRSICSKASLISLSDRRKQLSHTPAQTLTQVNEFPGQACAVDCSRSNDMLNQCTAQLTIFYDGKVTVYDNVPPEMAKAIMVVASSCDSSSQSFMNNEPTIIRSNSPLDGSKPVSVISTTLSGAANTSTEVAVAYNSLTEFSSTKSNMVPPILTYGTTAAMSAAVIPSTSVSTAISRQMDPGLLHADLPVARKASLARFLEKRKDRSHEKAATKEAHNSISVIENVALLSQRPESPKKLCIRSTSSPLADRCS